MSNMLLYHGAMMSYVPEPPLSTTTVSQVWGKRGVSEVHPD